MIELDGSRVRFAHPLLANGVYARARSSHRRAIHRRLSAAVWNLEERARHLAFAGIVPDAVAALDEAARYVRSRGAPDAAAELLELALGLGGGQELRLRAAEHHFDAGDPRRAQALLEEAIRALPAGEARAQALLLLAEVRYKDDSFPEARTLLEQAQTETGANERLRVMVDLRLAFTLFNLGLVPAAAGPAASALALAEQLDELALLAQALAVSVMVDFNLGLGVDEQRLTRALELEDPDLRTGSEFLPSLIASFIFLWTGRVDESRALLDAMSARHADRGEEHALAWALGFARVWLECWSGDLASATTAADAGVERLLALETTIGRALAFTSRAQLDAYAGRTDEARSGAEEALKLFERAGWQGSAGWPLMTLGFLELSVGQPEAAAARLGPVAAFAVATGLPEPAAGGALLTGDASEALVAAGRIEEARGRGRSARGARCGPRAYLGDRRRRALSRPPARRPRGRHRRRAGSRARAREPTSGCRCRSSGRGASSSSVASGGVAGSDSPPRPRSRKRSPSSRRSGHRAGPNRRRPRSPASDCAPARRTASRPRRSVSRILRPRASRITKWRRP